MDSLRCVGFLFISVLLCRSVQCVIVDPADEDTAIRLVKKQLIEDLQKNGSVINVSMHNHNDSAHLPAR